MPPDRAMPAGRVTEAQVKLRAAKERLAAATLKLETLRAAERAALQEQAQALNELNDARKQFQTAGEDA